MNITQIIEKLQSDPAFAAKYAALNGVDAILEQAKADGYNVTKADVETAMRELQAKSGELNEAELVAVSGGR